MAVEWDEAQLISDGFERVYVELEWYDGPRAGLADVDGRPHYFEACNYDYGSDFWVWPATDEASAWEREQWAIYVAWNERHKARLVGPETHPGHGGIDARYDELTRLLAPHRAVPDGARLVEAEMRFDSGDRYRVESVDYWFRWRDKN